MSLSPSVHKKLWIAAVLVWAIVLAVWFVKGRGPAEPEPITYEQLISDFDRGLVHSANWGPKNLVTTRYVDGSVRVVTVEKNSQKGADLANAMRAVDILRD